MYLRRLWHLARLTKSQWHSQQVIRKIQLQKLAPLLIYAYHNVGYYHSLFNSFGFIPDSNSTFEKFEDIPITTKKDLRAAGFDRIFSKVEKKESCINKFTSGSCGEPFDIYFRKGDYDVLTALTVRNYGVGGLKLYSRRVEIGNPEVIGNKESVLNLLGFWQTKNISTFVSPEEMVSLINLYKPDTIVSYPSVLKLLCRHIMDNRKPIFSPRTIFTRSELLDEETRGLAKKIFGAEVFDFFGCWEMGLFAFECTEHQGYHISTDTCILEFINSEDKKAKEGESANMVCTNLYSYAMPFIRYAIGDMGAYSNEPCRCGRGLPRLIKICGRTDDCIMLKDGATILPSSIVVSFKNIEGISRYRVIQENLALVVIQLEVDKKSLIKRIIAKLYYNMNKLFEGKIKIQIKIVESLNSDSGGKFKSVISKIENNHKCIEKF